MSKQKILLHLGTIGEDEYANRLNGTTAGQQVAWKQRLSTPGTIAELEMQCQQAGVSGVVCTNQYFLEKLLHAQSDFNPPNNRRGVTLDDYQGSLLYTPRTNLPVVILNPLRNLVTTPYASVAAKRFISKLTQPEKWFKQTPFTWELANLATIEQTYNRWIKDAAVISVDIETIVDDPDRRISCIGFCAYFPATNTSESLVIPFTDFFWILWARKFCQLPQPKIFQGGLYDNLYLLRWGCVIHSWLYDTLHLFHSWYAEFPKRLDFITAFCIRDVRYWKDDGKSGSLEDYYRYNAKDCWATLNSFLAMMQEVPEYAFNNYVTEFPLVFPCLTCELEGMAVDMQRLSVVKAEEENKVEQMNLQFQTLVAAPGFNVNSPKQVKNLFTVLGVGHLPDTAKASMLKAQASTPFNGRILEQLTKIREARKLVSTYFKPEKFWNSRLFYRLDPAGTDSGRLASRESSFWCGLQIQNIPRGKSVKQCLVSDAGYFLCEIDKAQSEARCVGYLSGEEALIELVESEHDYHSWNAAAFFGIPYEKIYNEHYTYDDITCKWEGKTLDKVIRDLAKRTNHGANYNMGPWMMLNTMGPKNVSIAKVALKLRGSLESVCKFLLDRYEATYKKVKGLWYGEIVAEIEKTGKLVSALGWTRVFFAKPRSSKPALNSAVAHPAQNLSVAIINMEFYNVWRSQIYGEYWKHDSTLIPLGGFTARERIGKARQLVANATTALIKAAYRIKAQIHDSILGQYKQEHPEIPALVRSEFMDTAVLVRGADGVVRRLFIPSDISAGKSRWSDLK